MNDTWRSRLKEILHITADPFLRDFHKLHQRQRTNLQHPPQPRQCCRTDIQNTIIKSMEESMFRPLIPTQQMKRRQNDHHHQGPPQKSRNLRSTPKITTSNRSTKPRLVSQPTTRRFGGYDSARAVPIDRTRSLAPCRALLPHPDTCTDKTPPRKPQSVDDRKL